MSDEIDKNYTILVAKVIKYIEKVKESEEEISLIDIISDFCFKNNIEPAMMGDAIKNDLYFKSFITKDCEEHNIIRQKDRPVKINKGW